MHFRSLQQNPVPEIWQSGGKDRPPSTVPRSTPICVFLMKTSRNFWSYVTVCLKFKFSKVFNYFENLEKMLVDPVLSFFYRVRNMYFVCFYQNRMCSCYRVMFVRVFSGFCMLLNKNHSIVDLYDCSNFTKGCPNSTYQSQEVYKCKYDKYTNNNVRILI